MPRTFLNLDPQNRLRGDPGGRAHPSRETRTERSAVQARVCRPGRGHNGAAARGGTGSPESWARPIKTRGDRRGGPAAGSRPQGAIMGGVHVPDLVPDSPSAGPRVHPGSSPEPVPDRPLEPVPGPPRCPSRIPLEPVPVPVHPVRRRTSPSRVSSGTLGFTGSAALPSAGTHETGRRVPRSAPLCSRPPSPSLGPGLPVVRPLAPRAWIDLVALASGSRNRPASTARLPIPGSQPARRSPSLTRAPRAPAAA